MALDIAKQDFSKWDITKLKYWNTLLKSYGFFTDKEKQAVNRLREQLKERLYGKQNKQGS